MVNSKGQIFDMRTPITTAALSAFLVAHSAVATQCAAPPLNLPLRTVSVASGILFHGIPISIGTPPQQIVLTPSLQLDTPFIPRYTNSCIHVADTNISANDTRWSNEDGKTVCAGIYGGGFVPSLSTTFYDNGTNSPVSEAWFKKNRFFDWHFMTDEFVFADYLEAYVQQNNVLPEKRNINTSFIFPDEGATFGGLGSSALSLTPGSRLLETLYAEGLVASKSWSLSTESLCLGCVDGNAYTGEFQNIKLMDRERDGGLPCLLQVKVESLEYHTDATSAGVALLDNAFVACVDPGAMFLALPKDARMKLSEVGGAEIERFSDTSIPFAGLPQNGSSFLRFKLESGLKRDVALLVVEAEDAKDAGEQVFALETGLMGAYGEGVPVLGKPFTDSIVLRWDETTQEYGIADRNSKAAGKNELESLGCDNFPSVSRSVETTPSVGVIVGAIIGGFVAGLLFAAAAVFFYWRGQSDVKSKYEAMHGEDAISLRTVDTGGRALESRMSDAPGAPAPSLRKSLQSHFGERSVSPFTEPYLIGDSQVFEAPEGGAVDSSKRSRVEMSVYSYDHR